MTRGSSPISPVVPSQPWMEASGSSDLETSHLAKEIHQSSKTFAEFMFLLLIFCMFPMYFTVSHCFATHDGVLGTSRLMRTSTVQLPCISMPFLPSFFWLRRALRLRLRFLLRSSPISLLNANAVERHVPPALREELELRRFRSWHALYKYS